MRVSDVTGKIEIGKEITFQQREIPQLHKREEQQQGERDFWKVRWHTQTVISLSSSFLPSCLHFPQHTGLLRYREKERGSLVEVEMVHLLPRQILASFLFKCHPCVEGVTKVIRRMTSVMIACSCTCLLACICLTDNVWWYKLQASRVLDIHADTEIKLKAYDNAGQYTSGSVT